MFLILNWAVKELLNVRMERFQSSFLLSVWKVYAHISTRRYNVEFGIKHINTMHNTVESRKSESSVTLILTDSILAEIIRKKKGKNVRSEDNSTTNKLSK